MSTDPDSRALVTVSRPECGLMISISMDLGAGAAGYVSRALFALSSPSPGFNAYSEGATGTGSAGGATFYSSFLSHFSPIFFNSIFLIAVLGNYLISAGFSLVSAGFSCLYSFSASYSLTFIGSNGFIKVPFSSTFLTTSYLGASTTGYFPTAFAAALFAAF